ncbi:MAG: hypothetical protein A2Z08_05025 [Deltaproteobacteria bacterium RBG_16_54_11]|nr:MAG: hypothetical protein A2Z08_05025 [Deltaproteobacteria bacterium RBG_16_54_11]
MVGAGEGWGEAEAEGDPLASGPDQRITVGLARCVALRSPINPIFLLLRGCRFAIQWGIAK